MESISTIFSGNKMCRFMCWQKPVVFHSYTAVTLGKPDYYSNLSGELFPKVDFVVSGDYRFLAASKCFVL